MKPLTFKSPLPDNILKMLDHAERKRLGKHFRTMNEINADNEHKNERDLHSQIENILRLKGIQYFHSRTDRKTTRPKGEPDFLASVIMQKPSKHDPVGSVQVVTALAIEVKLPGKKLSPEQEEMFRRMTAFPNGWMCRVVYSVDDVLAILKELGL